MADQGWNEGEEWWREHAREVIRNEVGGTCICEFFFFLLFSSFLPFSFLGFFRSLFVISFPFSLLSPLFFLLPVVVIARVKFSSLTISLSFHYTQRRLEAVLFDEFVM